MEEKKVIRVQLYEDNAELRSMLSILIQNSPGFTLAGAYENATHAASNVESQHPDVVLFDIEMPETNGLEGVKRIRAREKERGAEPVNIVMWSVFDQDEFLFEALKRGANGYLLKGTSPAQILEAVKEVMQGGAPMNPSIAKRVLQSFSGTSAKEAYALTEREKEILFHLVEGKSYKMVASSLNISLQTVKTHVKNVYEKLHVHSQSEAVAKSIRERLV